MSTLVENEEYLKGYRDGWQDAIRLKETMPDKPGQPSGPEFSYPACRVCGLKGVMGYVCPRYDCPTKITC